ncbi:hypothetical protein D0U04_21230 [Bacillus clarus]|uniref:Uncharacterized protein n=1 Tax=Bacillus clarus TaxID=2338372 RepID=A0A090YYV1_9BACI|nr:hypothetical protein [Bacillus clarus]KFN03303.1 hypothetical protein DJ93_3609 [Bacillus clarus]RFT64886.1 hypothetical protein D0U04_21230 [Bacillus clarus]
MEKKHEPPTIHMKNSGIVIIKNSASILIGLFCILLLFTTSFRKSKCPKCSRKEKKKAIKE